MRYLKSILLPLALSITLGLSGRAFAAPPESAQQFIKDMVYNELQDRERDLDWSYRVVRTTPGQTIVAYQVETSDGPIYRIFKKNGTTLTGAALDEENARLDKLLNSPSELAKNRDQHRNDEQRLRRLMKLMPDAFLYDYDGPADGAVTRVSFRPNPGFVPQTWEARVYHGLAGTVLVDSHYKRLIDINGKLVDRIDFGFGLLGHIEKGTFEVHRQKVSDSHWKTNLVDIYVDGKLILFKSVSKQQREERSGFRPVPENLSLAQARKMLDEASVSQ